MLQAIQDLRKSPTFPVIRERLRVSPFLASFLILVILPTIVSAVYFTFIASRGYVSEAKFVVRASSSIMQQPSRQTPTSAPVPTPSTAQPASSNRSGGFRSASSVFASNPQTANQDAFIVAEYIRSRAIVEDLGGKTLMFSLFAKPEIDWWSRLGSNATFEEIKSYWAQKVVVTVDTVSGILTLRVWAFSPEDARRLADLIVTRSETLANEISERNRNDALTRAEAELTIARKRLGAAQEAVLAFRNRASVVDPVAKAESTGELIAELMRNKIALENTRNVVSGLASGDTPSIRLLNAQLDALNKQIDALKEELASPGRPGTVSGQIAGYQELQLEQQFAQTLYSIGMTSFEMARANLERQQLYVLPLARPGLPEEVGHPRILLDTFMIFSAFLAFWSMGALLFASIKDHIE